jgi:hypothetical protein
MDQPMVQADAVLDAVEVISAAEEEGVLCEGVETVVEDLRVVDVDWLTSNVQYMTASAFIRPTKHMVEVDPFSITLDGALDMAIFSMEKEEALNVILLTIADEDEAMLVDWDVVDPICDETVSVVAQITERFLVMCMVLLRHFQSMHNSSLMDDIPGSVPE